MPGPNMEAATLTDKEICGRLVSLAEHQHPEKLSTEDRAIWRLICREAAERLSARPEAERSYPAIWLKTDDRGHTVVEIEVAGRWVEVIRDPGEIISHIVEPTGIKNRVDAACEPQGESK